MDRPRGDYHVPGYRRPSHLRGRTGLLRGDSFGPNPPGSSPLVRNRSGCRRRAVHPRRSPVGPWGGHRHSRKGNRVGLKWCARGNHGRRAELGHPWRRDWCGPRRGRYPRASWSERLPGLEAVTGFRNATAGVSGKPCPTVSTCLAQATPRSRHRSSGSAQFSTGPGGVQFASTSSSCGTVAATSSSSRCFDRRKPSRTM